MASLGYVAFGGTRQAKAKAGQQTTPATDWRIEVMRLAPRLSIFSTVTAARRLGATRINRPSMVQCRSRGLLIWIIQVVHQCLDQDGQRWRRAVFGRRRCVWDRAAVISPWCDHAPDPSPLTITEMSSCRVPAGLALRPAVPSRRRSRNPVLHVEVERQSYATCYMTCRRSPP